MNWNNHSDLVGKHAFLSASKYHWINYDEEKLANTYSNHLAVQRGTELHEWASYTIDMMIKYGLPKFRDVNNTVSMYINDAVGFRMQTEQPLFYSDNAFGTCDAISFRDDFLRIHDLKTGITPANMTQLYVYTALFCLEYKIKPKDIGCELRIYQDGNILVDNPTIDEIVPIMDKIIYADKIIEKRKAEEGF